MIKNTNLIIAIFCLLLFIAAAYYFSIRKKDKTCEEGFVFDEEEEKCVNACEADKYWDKSQKVCLPRCQSNEILMGEMCIPRCGYGQNWDGTECVPFCLNGKWDKVNMSCKCEKGFWRNPDTDLCVNPCCDIGFIFSDTKQMCVGNGVEVEPLANSARDRFGRCEPL